VAGYAGFPSLSYETVNVPFIEPACGSQTNVYSPGSSATSKVVSPVSPTSVASSSPVPVMLMLGALACSF
jgi:hypothetical protein